MPSSQLDPYGASSQSEPQPSKLNRTWKGSKTTARLPESRMLQFSPPTARYIFRSSTQRCCTMLLTLTWPFMALTNVSCLVLPIRSCSNAAERDGDIVALPRRRFSIRVVQKAWPQPKRLKIGFICGSPACHQLKNNVLVHVSRTL